MWKGSQASIFGQSPNIASVTVNGQEVTQDFDLDGQPSFDVESDAGNRYALTVTSENPKKHPAIAGDSAARRRSNR
jgi:hypothetical protein